MEAANHVGFRFGQGALAYVGLNVILVAAELRWHVITRLLIWDIAEIRLLVFLVGKSLHP
jgi:hypothetical protein